MRTTQTEHDARMKEMKEIRASINLMRKERTEKNRPTVWVNSKQNLLEIHFEGKTILGTITGVDRETPRESSDNMAMGSGFKQVIYKTEDFEEDN